MELFGVIFQSFCKSEFIENLHENYLAQILSFCLIKSGSNLTRVLYFTLMDLAKSCGYSSTEEMLVRNLDFLCRDLNLRLRNITGCKSHNVHNLLKVILRLKSSDDLDVRDSLDALLVQLDLSWIGDRNDKLTAEILKIIQIYVENVNANYDKKEEQDAINRNVEEGAITTFIKGKFGYVE